ncbi:MAG: BrnT family toxin, partial [Acidobacteria bacterium]|nr:BrnT family toxin [Acidobacteriota bacterium]
IGRIGTVVWSAFVTIREGRVRIISVRRARHEEEAAYLES